MSKKSDFVNCSFGWCRFQFQPAYWKRDQLNFNLNRYDSTVAQSNWPLNFNIHKLYNTVCYRICSSSVSDRLHLKVRYRGFHRFVGYFGPYRCVAIGQIIFTNVPQIWSKVVISDSLPVELLLEISEVALGIAFWYDIYPLWYHRNTTSWQKIPKSKPFVKLTSGFHIGLSRRVDQEVGIFSYSTCKFKEKHFLRPWKLVMNGSLHS